VVDRDGDRAAVLTDSALDAARVPPMGAAAHNEVMSGAPKTVPIPRPVAEQWKSLAGNGSAPAFDSGLVKDLPDAVRRWLLHSIEPGTPLWESAEVVMHGRIKFNGNWLPFTAHQILAPARGFIWAARAKMRGLTISG
jgi:hypothetical protein